MAALIFKEGWVRFLYFFSPRKVNWVCQLGGGAALRVVRGLIRGVAGELVCEIISRSGVNSPK